MQRFWECPTSTKRCSYGFVCVTPNCGMVPLGGSVPPPCETGLAFTASLPLDEMSVDSGQEVTPRTPAPVPPTPRTPPVSPPPYLPPYPPPYPPRTSPP